MIHIASEDYTAGTRYNGTWTLSKSVSGNYQVMYQYMALGDIPWITSDTEVITIKYSSSAPYSFLLFPGADLYTYQFSTDLDAIATYIRNRFNTVFTNLGYGITMSSIYIDQPNERFQLNFSSSAFSIHWNDSTCASIFKQTGNNVTGNTFYMSYKNITLSCHLFLKIDESISSVVTTESDIDATIIYHTSDDPLTGQMINIRTSTNTLHMQMYRASYPEFPCPITMKWEIVLMPA